MDEGNLQATDAQDGAQPNPAVRTPFPDPPSYWTSFTAANVSAFEALEAKAAAGALPTPYELPPELQNLRPPTPPPNGEYRSFGEGRSVCRRFLLPSFLPLRALTI